jgi:transcriptional regulator with XRE-family HTH domain
MKSKETFGAILKRIRESRGLSPLELAEKAGISRMQIDRLEKGSRAPLWTTVQALSAALGVKCEAFEEAPSEEPTKPPKPAAKRKPKKPGA